MTNDDLERRVNELVAQKLAEIEEARNNRPKRLALIASRGTLDYAYPPFILATTAASMGWQVSVFFTFYGLPLLLKDLGASVTPLGNPAMPMKMPFGPEGIQKINWPIPTAMMAVPAVNSLGTTLMKQRTRNKGVSSIPELRAMSVELGVEMVACQMTMDVFGFKKEDFIDECNVAGAATFLEDASKSDVQLFV